MGYRYAVFGLGRQGTAAVYDLLVNCEADGVVGFDPDAGRRDAAERRIRPLVGQDAPLRVADAAGCDCQALAGEVDVVLSCAPYRFNPEITRSCLEAGLPVCDLGGNPDVVAEQERLAQGKNTPVVPECGLSPGLSNIAAVHLAKEHGVNQLIVRCGGLPADPPDPDVNPLQYKLVFDAQGLISEYSGQCPMLADGRLESVPACSFVEEFDPEHEAFPTSNNAPQVAEYLRQCGVGDYNYMTVRYHGHWVCLQGWKALGFLRGDAELDAGLRDLLNASDVLRYDPASDRDKVMLLVRGTREGQGLERSWEYRMEVAADPRTGFSAMELTTSWGGTIVAHHLASGKGRPEGFATPERFVDTGWVLGEVDRRLAQVQRPE